ncbi:MAG: hypothetical protein ABSD99_12805 [Candidatus Bathyarchaeia archaeon]
MCLNFVEGGRCHLIDGKCLLGERGATAKNSDGECEFHGKFDVWLTDRNDVFITDMGFPSDEPKQCLALGVKESLARTIATEKSEKFATTVMTSERGCIRCEALYWVSQHERSLGLHETGHNHFCPQCIGRVTDEEKERRLGAQRYWCG